MLIIMLKILAVVGLLAIGFFTGSWCNIQTNQRDLDNQIRAGYITNRARLYKVTLVKGQGQHDG